MKGLIIFISVLTFANSCVERADFDPKKSDAQLVVEGLITDEPGPYTVKLTRSRKPLDFSATVPVSAIRVTISDDAGTSEILSEVEGGIYQTSPTGIKGVVGRSYSVKIETRDGKIYESIPEKLTNQGSIDELYTKFVADDQTNGTQKWRFKVFMDAGIASGEIYYRWRFNAYFRVETKPELRRVQAGEGTVASPRACSGFIFNGELERVGPCTCCECWPKLVDTRPLLSISQIPSTGKYRGIEVGSVPVDYWMFFDKTMVEVQQLTISNNAARFWKTIQDQKDGSASLFQPAVGQALSNIIHKNGGDQVLGLFYAAGIVKRTIFINRSDIPSSVTIPDAPPPITESCIFAFPNSNNQPPLGWK
jgi:hypothetical protein